MDTTHGAESDDGAMCASCMRALRARASIQEGMTGNTVEPAVQLHVVTAEQPVSHMLDSESEGNSAAVPG